MFDPDRFVHVVFQIDTNRINAKGKLANMNQLETWREAGVILIHVSHVAPQEAKAGDNPQRSRKANSYVFTLD